MSKTVCFITRNFGKYDPDSLKGYESIGGFRALRKALTMEGYAIADVLAANGVQGRGGAAYDMGKKWRQARDVPGGPQVRGVQRRRGRAGHLQGSGAAHPRPLPAAGGHDHRPAGPWGRTTDTSTCVRSTPTCGPAALRHRPVRAAGYLGENILGSGLNYRIHLYSGAGAYVCGEGSALAESIGGHAGRPRA